MYASNINRIVEMYLGTELDHFFEEFSIENLEDVKANFENNDHILVDLMTVKYGAEALRQLLIFAERDFKIDA